MDGENRAFTIGVLIFISVTLLLPGQIQTGNAADGDYIGYTFENIHPFSINASVYRGHLYLDGGLEKAVYLKSMGTDIPNSIVVCDADGNNQMPVYSGNRRVENPVFNHNDSQILFKAEEYNGSEDIVSLNILIKNGSAWGPDAVFRQIYWNYRNETDITGFRWTPDGDIVFSMDFSVRPQYRGIYLVKPDGSDLRCIMHLSNTAYFPYISSNGLLTYYQPDSGYVYSYTEPYDNGRIASISYIGNSEEVSALPDGKIGFISFRNQYPLLAGTSLWMNDGKNDTLLIPGTMFGEGASVVRYFFSDDMKEVVFFVSDGYGTHFGAYYARDETGKWSDSDGDGVWDGVDGAPDDPTQGYSRIPLQPDYPLYTNSSFISGFAICTAAFLIIAALIVLFFIHVAKTSAKKGEKTMPPLPPMEEANVCPICGTPLVEKKGRKYCEKCRIYF